MLRRGCGVYIVLAKTALGANSPRRLLKSAVTQVILTCIGCAPLMTSNEPPESDGTRLQHSLLVTLLESVLH